MNESVITAMFSLIRRVVCGAETSEETEAAVTPECLPQLYEASKAHDMAHIVAQGLFDVGVLGKDEISQKFLKQQMLAVYRYQNLNCELAKLCQTLEEAHISFLPLKGSVLRAYYPEPWMRTSCDIDVLVHEEDVETAKSILIDRLGYIYHGKWTHDISLFSPTDIHVELHYHLLEDEYAKEAASVLKGVWETARVRDGYLYWHELPDEMFYFYHIAHMAKHFEEGGCGIRPFLDLWVLNHRVAHDETCDRLLEQGGLLTFANACRRLSAVWFDGAEHCELTEQIQSYVLRGGVYGALDNRVVVHQNKQGGKLKYIASRVFLPYDSLKIMYPILQKYRWLTPFMQVRRWFRLLRRGHFAHAKKELRYNRNVSHADAKDMQTFLENIGL